MKDQPNSAIQRFIYAADVEGLKEALSSSLDDDILPDAVIHDHATKTTQTIPLICLAVNLAKSTRDIPCARYCHLIRFLVQEYGIDLNAPLQIITESTMKSWEKQAVLDNYPIHAKTTTTRPLSLALVWDDKDTRNMTRTLECMEMLMELGADVCEPFLYKTESDGPVDLITNKYTRLSDAERTLVYVALVYYPSTLIAGVLMENGVVDRSPALITEALKEIGNDAFDVIIMFYNFYTTGIYAVDDLKAMACRDERGYCTVQKQIDN